MYMISNKKTNADIIAQQSFYELFGNGVYLYNRKNLTIEALMEEASSFCNESTNKGIRALYGITDGKAVGTIVEKMFKLYLAQKYDFDMGNSGSGVDLPDIDINTDIKVSSVRQPQSSSPYRDAKQKVFGLGYNLLLFVYQKKDINNEQKAYLEWKDCVFIEQEYTSDFTLTFDLINAKKMGATLEDIVSILKCKNIPGEESTLKSIANEILEKDIKQGQITISNALQWRLNYGRIVRYGSLCQERGVNKLI